MIYIGCGAVIVATHFFLGRNQWLHRQRLLPVMAVSLLLMLLSILVSTWLQTLLPTILTTLVSGTLLQVRFSTLSIR